MRFLLRRKLCFVVYFFAEVKIASNDACDNAIVSTADGDYRQYAVRCWGDSVGAGVTRDTPDVSLSLRLPVTF